MEGLEKGLLERNEPDFYASEYRRLVGELEESEARSLKPRSTCWNQCVPSDGLALWRSKHRPGRAWRTTNADWKAGTAA